MSIEAFCLLAGIPDVGLRMQTLRITEFFLLINSHNCVSGKTTLARLCALTHQSSTQVVQVLQNLFHKDTKINHRKKNRLADIVKWMKKLEVHIMEQGEDKSDIMEKINKLSQILRHNTNPNQHIVAYTDGSTETKTRKSKNSGYGIYITTNSHMPICSGGGAVRSDGNNFVAEMAAATVVIKALPLDRTLTLHIDSMAAIQSLEQGPVSERKRIKMQGRAWKSFLKTTLAEKRQQICILHVKSHSGLGSPQQQGNDQADKIAKNFMSQAEKLGPLPYFIAAEEHFLASHRDTLIGGNIRIWLKEQEIERLQDAWRKLKVQGRLFRRFPQQIKNLTKLIKNWSIKRNEGKAWMFFIFAVCDWLPLNHRIHNHGNDKQKTLCNLCQSNAAETTEHLFSCPALREEQNAVREEMDGVFKKWSIPYSALGHLPGLSVKSQWINMLQKKLSINKKSLTLSGEKMQQLVEDYWTANRNNRHKAFPHFWKCINQVLKRYKCSCNNRHSCELRNCWATPPSLIALLQKHFCLEVEGMADALHHSCHLKEWYSLYQEDKSFGAKHDFFQQELAGKNTYINPPFNTFEGNQNLIEKVIMKVSDSLRSNLPTRTILLIPIFEGKIGHLYETQARQSRFLEIATFPKGSFSFVAPEHYHIHNNFCPGFFSEKVGLYLCANKASLQIDPIDWDAMSRDLMTWSQENTKSPPTPNPITRQKFAQRMIPSHSARCFNTQSNLIFKPSNNFFHYYDFSFSPANETNSMKTFVRNSEHLELLSRMNQHDRLAGSLGILPNHLIKLLRLVTPEDSTKITSDLRLTIFWSTYRIWTKRQSLNRTYWNILPECCKTQVKPKKVDTLRKKRKRRTKKLALEDCKNPFHYLLLKNNMQPIQGTCNCNLKMNHLKKDTNYFEEKTNLNNFVLHLDQQSEIKANPHDIKNPEKIREDINGLDHKHIRTNQGNQRDIRQFLYVKTSADISREEQDRKKRFKK
jgi:ribonuclease HI